MSFEELWFNRANPASNNWWERAALARNSRTPSWQLIEMLEIEEDIVVRDFILENPNCPDWVRVMES